MGTIYCVFIQRASAVWGQRELVLVLNFRPGIVLNLALVQLVQCASSLAVLHAKRVRTHCCQQRYCHTVVLSTTEKRTFLFHGITGVQQQRRQKEHRFNDKILVARHDQLVLGATEILFALFKRMIWEHFCRKRRACNTTQNILLLSDQIFVTFWPQTKYFMVLKNDTTFWSICS